MSPASLPSVQRSSAPSRQARLQRLMTESITVQFVETTEESGKRLFVDINDNVKSVRPDFRLFLDDRTAVGLIAGDVIETHPLLVGRVEHGAGARLRQGQQDAHRLKAVGDIVRAVLLGTVRVASARGVEDELRAEPGGRKTAEVKKFFDLLVNYTDLRKVADNELDPQDLRYDPKEPDKPHATMLASTTMLRVHVGVYHDLTVTDPKTGMAADGKPPMTRWQRSASSSAMRSAVPRDPGNQQHDLASDRTLRGWRVGTDWTPWRHAQAHRDPLRLGEGRRLERRRRARPHDLTRGRWVVAGAPPARSGRRRFRACRAAQLSCGIRPRSGEAAGVPAHLFV